MSKYWVPQRAPAPRLRRIKSPWGENPRWMADRAASMVGLMGMEDRETLGDLLSEGAVPSYAKKWLMARFGATSVRKGKGSTAKQIIVGGDFDSKEQSALRYLGFKVVSARMATIGTDTAAWDDVVRWAQLDKRRGTVEQDRESLGELLAELRRGG